MPHIRQAIEENLSRLLGLTSPHKQISAWNTFTNYCRCVAHAYSMHSGIDLNIPTSIVGYEKIEPLFTNGQGVIMATGHLGNWQIAPYLLKKQKLPQITVVMNEEPHEGTQHLEDIYRDKQMRVVYPGRSPLLSLELRAALYRGELVGFQMDRPSATGGISVNCAGGQASFASGPALLSRACGVPVVPVFFPLDGKGIQIRIEKPLWAKRTNDRQQDLQELTSRLAECYSRTIRLYPEQWFNFYNFWT